MHSFSVNATSVFNVSVLDSGKKKQEGLGTLIAEEMLLVNAKLTELGDQILVTDPSSGSTLLGQQIASDLNKQLALVRVSGIKGTPISLAKDELIVGRNISVLFGAKVNGVVRTLLQTNKDYSFVRVEHTVELNETQFGAPILNNCGELAGISVHDQKGIFDQRLAIDEDFSKASDKSTLLEFLKQNSVAFSESQVDCISEAEQLRLLEQEKAKSSELATKTEEQKKAAEAELERLRLEKETHEKALKAANKKLQEEAENKKQENQQEIDRIEAELEKARLEKLEQEAMLEQVRENQQKQQEALNEAKQARLEKEKKLAEIEAEKEQEEETKVRSWIIAGAVFVLLFIILIVMMIVRRKQITKIEQQAKQSEAKLASQTIKASDAEQALAAAKATFNDIVFAGIDETDGNEYRVKLTGKLLARTEGGLLIGRSVQSVDCLLAAPSVSKVHAKVTLENNIVYIQDLGSSNGTQINGVNCGDGEKQAIKHDDTMRIGRVTGTFIFID